MKWIAEWAEWTDNHPFWTVALANLPFLPLFIVYWYQYHNTEEYKGKNTWEWYLGRYK
jgi:hypothetical protein